MWKAISEKYEVSDKGEIRMIGKTEPLHQFIGKDGYMRTQFAGKTRIVHRVVAKAFIPNPDNLPEVNHIDGNKQNNCVENLEWITRSDNLKHAYKIGLKKSTGERNPRAKLTEEDVNYLRSLYKDGTWLIPAKSLAKQFGVAHQTISAAVCGQNWNLLKEEGELK